MIMAIIIITLKSASLILINLLHEFIVRSLFRAPAMIKSRIVYEGYLIVPLNLFPERHFFDEPFDMVQ